jgi:PPOX class probable FMN-dependent enzyme
VTADELRELLGGEPSATSRGKEIGVLDGHCRAFLARSPFFVLATSAPDGRGDASPKGGPPGFVHVLDDLTLAYGELPGNRRLDSFENALAQPHVGLLFMVPGVEETLRVNGTLSFSREPELLGRLALRGRAPVLAVVVRMETAYLHCAKALKRSRLWQRDAWPSLDGLAPAAQIFRDHVADERTVEEVQAHLDESYATRLW